MIIHDFPGNISQSSEVILFHLCKTTLDANIRLFDWRIKLIRAVIFLLFSGKREAQNFLHQNLDLHICMDISKNLWEMSCCFNWELPDNFHLLGEITYHFHHKLHCHVEITAVGKTMEGFLEWTKHKVGICFGTNLLMTYTLHFVATVVWLQSHFHTWASTQDVNKYWN